MNQMSRLFFAGVFASALCMAPPAGALTIVRNFGGGSSSGSNTGTGTLQTVFNAAADCWEAAILDSHTLTLAYDWGTLSGGTLGEHSFGGGSGTPYRETSGSIKFSNTASMFLDSTPLNTSEYSTYTSSSANLGGGTINTGRVYTGATGDAVGKYDLFTIALHEIGHALGLSSGNSAFFAAAGPNGPGRTITTTTGRPHVGSVLPVENSTAHLSITTALMYPSVSTGKRVFFSAADILANAEISKFTNLNLNAHNPVPEPATLSLAALALGGAVRRRRARKAA